MAKVNIRMVSFSEDVKHPGPGKCEHMFPSVLLKTKFVILSRKEKSLQIFVSRNLQVLVGRLDSLVL